MNKRYNLIYWVATGLLAVGMVAQGVAQVVHTAGYAAIMTHLGYPLYFLTIIGTGKLLGTVAILLPGFQLLKEWAYAGFFFVMSGAATSHLATGESVTAVLPSLVLLSLIVVSWQFRPADRKVSSLNPFQRDEQATVSTAA
ncbi:DoxX family protein [Fibrella sp. HMF5335]|uniref:DoxX family protein n=1 Tax=Fibrella rubiginis TaxID=2817060 RepID=A0A939K0Q8_9BACT|nr:DoxX family protein [Fibrella rubiginis]MBO0936352.1 DoxX family protein [Fibrella rubiginis]